MNTKIYYFSGTGNSFFIAKLLNDSLKDSEIIPIVKLLKSSQKQVVAEKVVIVFPIHALTIPLPVREFLKEYDFSNVEYISAVATRLGLYFNDFERIDKLIKPQKLDSHFIINMGNNDVKVKNYKCPTEDEIKVLEFIAKKEVDVITKIIKNNGFSKEKDINYLLALPYGDIRDKFIEWLIPKMMTFSKHIGGVNYFYINSNCNGCSICSKVCLSEKIKMDENRPNWNKKILCHMCYACINYCPANAIQIRSIPGVPSFTHENERYSHPYADYKEIQNQKD